ncbi:hypothetical protein ACFYOC_24130 [Nocardiopsis alba]|uniref:hypothetical protein n=1 Tax=Nocardiopsis alba TaxID=53437 RepID=UPI0036C9E0A4
MSEQDATVSVEVIPEVRRFGQRMAQNLRPQVARAWKATDRYLRGESAKTGAQAGKSIGQGVTKNLSKETLKTTKVLQENITKNAQQTGKKYSQDFGKGLGTPPTIKPNVDPKQAKEEIQRLRQEVARNKVTLSFDAHVRQQSMKEEIALLKAQAAREQILLRAELNAARVRAQLERLQKDQKVNVDAELNDSGIAARMAWLARDRIIKLRVRVDNTIRHLNQVTGLLGIIGTPANLVVKASGLTSAASGLFVVVQALASIGVGIAQASGALLTLPAILAGVGAGIGVLVIAFQGFGDALSSDSETAQAALEDLTPSAREAALALRGLTPALGQIREAVQEAFFSGLAPQLSTLSTSLLPELESGLEGIGGSANGAALELLSFANSKDTLADTRTILDNIRGGFDALVPSVQPVSQALRDITAVGSEYLPAMGEGVSGVTTRFAEFISHARETGQLNAWIDQGVVALRELGSILGSTGSIFSGLFTGLSSDMPLQTVADGFSAVAEAVNGENFQGILSAFSEAFSNNLSAVSESLPSVGEAFSELLPSITGFIEAGGSSFGEWLQSVSDIALQFKPVIDGLVAAFAWFAPVLSSFAPYLTLVTAGIIAFRVAMFALNLVMYANPVGLVVAAIALLVAGLLWAYNNVEWFRTGVQAVWSAISTGAMWLWNNALLPFFTWIYNFITVTLAPVWAFLATAIGFYLKAVQVYIAVAWAVIQVIWQALVFYIQNILIPYFQFLWSVVQVVWKFISTAISVAWGIIQIIFAAIVFVLRNTLGPIFNWLYNSVIQPVWNGIRSAISTVWNFIRDKVFSPMRSGITSVADTFEKAKGWIETAWKGIRDAAKVPIKFLVDTVYSGALKPMWDKVAGIVGADKLPSVTLPKGFAGGGVLPGYSTFRQGDSINVPMRPGEGVYVSEAMKNPYERARLLAVNRAAMRGQSLSQFQGGESLGFARGGWLGVKNIAPAVGGISDGVAKFIKDIVVDVFTGDLGGAVDTFFKPIHAATKQFGTEGIPGIPHMGGKKINEFMKEKVESLAHFWQGDGGGANEWTGLESASERLRRAATWARTQHGLPYQWGGNGNPSWDCSGFVSAIESQLRSGKAFRRWSTHAFAGNSAPAGWVRSLKSPFEVGITHAGVGHTAGTLMGVNVESAGGGKGVRVGSSARGSRNSMFTSWYGFKPVVGDDVARMATGGWVKGRGTGTSDSNMILASHGEYMIRAKQAAKHGPLLEAINNDELRAFNTNLSTRVSSREEGSGGQPLIGTLNASVPEGSDVKDLVHEISLETRKVRIGRKY